MRKRFARDPRTIHLTDRDLRTVGAVFEARYLTAKMVGRLFYPSGAASRCRERLRKLYDARYLVSTQMIMSPGQPSPF